MRLGMRRRRIHARRASRQCSLAVEHPLSKREVVGSNPAIGSFAGPERFELAKSEAREIRTPNRLIWSQTRYRCAMAPSCKGRATVAPWPLPARDALPLLHGPFLQGAGLQEAGPS